MNRLDDQFSRLRDGLICWRRIGHGLWPLRYWPDSVIENYVLILQEAYQVVSIDRPFVFFSDNGQGFILLARHILDGFKCSVTENYYPTGDHPVVLLETILAALIGLVYAEEPGDLTIEQVLIGY